MLPVSSWSRAVCEGKALPPLLLLERVHSRNLSFMTAATIGKLRQCCKHGRRPVVKQQWKGERVESVSPEYRSLPGLWAAVKPQNSAGAGDPCRYLAMRRLQQARSAATLLQAHWRGRAARQATKRIRVAITLQRFARGTAVRRALARQHGAAMAIQSAWRQRQAMRRYTRDVQDITFAQVRQTFRRINWW